VPPKELLCKRFKNEAVAVYQIKSLGSDDQPHDNSPLNRYVVSTVGTRKLINEPEVLNRDFVDHMVRGLAHALVGLDRIEHLSTIPSKSVNVFHILRGGLNFRLVRALQHAYGYEWHSSSFMSSQRVRVGDSFDIEDDAYRKFVVPERPTIYTGDIIATGASVDAAMGYLYRYLVNENIDLENFVFVTIGCAEAEPVMERWHRRFKETFTYYDRTILIYLEGRFGMATDETPLNVSNPGTDLLRSYKQGSLHTPEFEYSQFDRVLSPLEACTIYDGGKKSFEPVHHIEEIRRFWAAQYEWATKEQATLWDEYNRRFPLDPYFQDITTDLVGSPGGLARAKASTWWGLSDDEYLALWRRFRWLWTDERLQQAHRPGSFVTICEKKLQDLDRHL